jgi:hypothetical protein
MKQKPKRGKSMARVHDNRSGGHQRGDDRSEDNRREKFDDPEEHREIEKRRFHGSLPATPELYARAREQWYRLPGSVVRPPMDPVIADPNPDQQPPPGQPGGKRTQR